MFTTENFDITEIIERTLSKISSIKKEIIEENLKEEKKVLENLSLGLLLIAKERREASLEIRKHALNNHISYKKGFENDLVFYKNVGDDISLKRLKNTRIRLMEIEKEIEQLEIDVLGAFRELQLVDEVIEENINSPTVPCFTAKEISNHNKLLSNLLNPNSFASLKDKGFKGDRKDFVTCLVYALDATGSYVYGSDLSEKEYYKLLTEQMNSVL